MTPLGPLKAAIRAVLIGDAALSALTGGAKVFDEVPRGADPPYLAFGEAQSRANGSLSGQGHVSDLQLVAWSRQGGTAEALALAARAEALLEDAALDLQGHRLVLLTVTGTDLRHDPARALARAILRLRALTESL